MPLELKRERKPYSFSSSFINRQADVDAAAAAVIIIMHIIIGIKDKAAAPVDERERTSSGSLITVAI